VKRCYKCESPDHVVAVCPYNSDNDEDDKKKQKKEKKEKKDKKMTFQKKKGRGYVLSWDSDSSLVESDSSDDDKKSKKKAFASFAINNKPSLFDTPSTCLMAKPTKIIYDMSDDDDDCESDDCRSDDDDEEYTKEELMDMCEQVHTCFEMKRKECKELRKKVKSLEQSFDELNPTHERLMEAHKKKQVIMSCDVGLTCDILDESFYKPIIVAPINPSCSTTTFALPLSDGFSCDASLMVEN
jgi:hypothetical protein